MAIDLFSIGNFTIHGYGLMIGLGFLLAILSAGRRAKLYGLSDDHVVNVAIWVLVIGFLGGKLLFLIVEFKQFLQNPLAVLGSEGFVVYGGIITGIFTIIVYCKIKKLDVLSYFDILVPSVSINQALGRVGCFLAGCCYGRPTNSPLGVIFPEGSLAPTGVKVLPTQLFSAAGNMLIAVVLILYARKSKWKGSVVSFWLILYSIGRFIIEIFRNDNRGSVGMLSTSQFISIFALIGGILLLFITKKLNLPADKPYHQTTTKNQEV